MISVLQDQNLPASGAADKNLCRGRVDLPAALKKLMGYRNENSQVSVLGRIDRSSLVSFDTVGAELSYEACLVLDSAAIAVNDLRVVGHDPLKLTRIALRHRLAESGIHNLDCALLCGTSLGG